MGKSIKEKLRDQQKQNHQEFRKQLINDIYQLLDKWLKHVEGFMAKKTRENYKAIDEMGKVTKDLRLVSDNLNEIRRVTTAEIKKLKRGRNWKFYLTTFLVSVFSSFFTLLLAAKYWPEIRAFFM